MSGYRIGIDLGGTKIEGVLMTSAGDIARRLRTPTPAAYADILRALQDLVAQLRRGEPIAGIGMSAPGNETLEGLVKNSNSTCLNGMPFFADVRRVLECDVRFANDANCLALSEATDGAGADADTVFAAILGTGVGGGIAVNKRVMSGKNRLCGEWGHAPLPWPAAAEYPGPKCYCGRRGCIEVFVSGTGMQNDYARAIGGAVGGVAGGVVGGTADGAASALEIAADAEAGAAEAVAARQRYAHRLARALAMIVNILDPDVIVLGGGISNIDFLYDALPALVHPWVFGGEFATPIKKATHGDSSGVRGAAWLADETRSL